MSIQSDKKSLEDASNLLGGENNIAGIDTLQEVNPCRSQKLSVCLGVGVMPPPRKQTEDCKERSVSRLLVISERLPPDKTAVGGRRICPPATPEIKTLGEELRVNQLKDTRELKRFTGDTLVLKESKIGHKNPSRIKIREKMPTGEDLGKKFDRHGLFSGDTNELQYLFWQCFLDGQC